MSVVAPVRRGRLVLALATAFVAGGLIALQSRINGELGLRTGDGFVAAFISFGSGLVLLAIACLVWPAGRRGIRRVVAAVQTRELPWWFLLGGVAGAAFVLGQGLTVGVLGVALFTVGIVCGQTVSSLVIDHHGIARMPRNPATPRRLIGAALAVAAVVVAVSDRLTVGAPYLALLVPLVAGVFAGWQPVVNGQVRIVAGSALTATFGNFLVGAIVLGVALAVHTAVVGWRAELPSEPWLYTGGVIACVFIAAQAVIVRTTGVLLLTLALLAGQLVSSVVLDLVLPVDGAGLHLTTVAGTAVIFGAVLVAAVPSRRARVTAS